LKDGAGAFPFYTRELRGPAVVLGDGTVRWVHWLSRPDGEEKLRGGIVRDDGKSFDWSW
jgi:hypothetical protein